MKYFYQTLLKAFVVTLVSLFVLAPTFASAQVSGKVGDIAPADIATEGMCISLTSNFGYRATDQTTSGSVSLLQDFLISKGYLNSESTGYFGGMTLKAVTKYQNDKGFNATGYVGNYTRGAIRTDTCGGTSQQGAAGSVNNTTSSATGVAGSASGGANSTGSTSNTGFMKVIVKDATGKPSLNSYFKCGNKTDQTDIIQYSPNSNGEVTFSPSDCRKKGASMWISCPVGQVSSLTSEVLADYKDQTVVTCATADYIKKAAAVVAASVTTAATCPDGTARQLVVVSPSTGCEGHENPTGSPAVKSTTATATTCPDGSPKPLVVPGASNGCENHEFKFSLLTSNSLNNFVQNGNLYNSMPAYNRLTGVSRKNPPMLCIQLQGNTNCSVSSGYRDVLPSEWLTDTVVQTVIQDPSIYPASTYTTYVIYPNGSPIRTGYFSLVAGSPTATAVPTLSVSNTYNGPYVVSGTVYNNSPIYSQTTGVQKGGAPKGCMQVAGDTACNLASSYRSFTATEWVSDTTIQTTVSNPAAYPVGRYEGFVMYPSGKPIKTGTFTLAAPAPAVVAAPTPAPSSPTCAGPGSCGGTPVIGGYSWRVLINTPVGPTWQGLDARSLSPPSEECNASIVNQTKTVSSTYGTGGVDTIRCEAWYK